MIISLIVEPRSGSTNLANCFFNDKDFTVLYTPSNHLSKWYIDDKPKNYRFITKHLMVKEDFYENKNFDELIDISDKVIFLYRENRDEQIKSWINAKVTNNWDAQWKYSEKVMLEQQSEIDYFTNLKYHFNKLINNNTNALKISYEDLYEKNGFYKIREFLGDDICKNINFPMGKRYRINTNKINLI